MVTKAQDVFVCRNAALSFFSSAPIEDIEAHTDKGVSALNVKTRAIYFKVPIRSFQFRKSLMQEHFNENFLESDQYPYAEFTGQVTGDADLTQPGTYPVTVEGKLTIHGVTKAYKENGTITVGDKRITAVSDFKVRVADHHIKIPTIVIRNIAEVVDVKVNAVYVPQ